MEWMEQPCKIDNISDIDCIFAIDENGTSSIKNVNDVKNNKLFTITGVHISLENFEDIRDSVMEMKKKHWIDGMFKNKRVVFHSKDIRKKQGAFNPKLINYQGFIDDLHVLLHNIPIKIYSATIDKNAHCQKYITPYPPYEIGAEFILERLCFDLRRSNKTGIIIFESRGKVEDSKVLKKIIKLLKEGNEFNDTGNFSVIRGVYFNPKRTEDKLLSYWPLELSDIISYSIFSKIKTNSINTIFENIEEKILGFPNYEGKGMKIFP
ncbi:hypothetical protein LDK94_06555 [Staphylococcus arlettae]|uniref:DUF3800 domain-containing protein n=1 Tax=Staphylococcus arlettae TaxID=29378 RepID=UPI001E586B06|nr:DUF3800 domain-containing protein [Staphylococcus arlettae]MCD9054995.1 hypothetical protein [Staphylococcus arlettae]